MKINLAISSILREAWLLDEGYANAQMPLVLQMLNGKPIAFDANPKTEESLHPFLILNDNTILRLNATASSSLYATEKSSTSYENVIAVVPIKGVVMKEDNCGEMGSMSRAKQMINLANNDNVSAIIMIEDTPGGSVRGSQTFADAVTYATTKKPVLTWVEDGIAASAGYWFASQSTEIYVSHEINQVGSIGVFVKLIDEDGALKDKKYKVVNVYADGSEDKNAEATNALNGNPKMLKENTLNPIRAAFVDAVTKGRGDRLNLKAGNPFTGKMYNANEAIELGLIDGVMNFEGVVARANELAKNKKKIISIRIITI